MVNAVIAVSLGAMTLSSCIGSFCLTNNVLDWNKRATDNKFVNELIFIVISPAYAVCSVADLFVLNSIEFWTGSNPLADVGKTKQVMGQDGRYYAVTTLKNGYEVKAPTGEVTRFIHDQKTDSWSMEQDGVVKEIFRFNGDGTIMANINGETESFTLNQEGVNKARLIANSDIFFAMN